MVPAEQMAAYLSAQVNALRYFSATSAQPRDHWGFAWAPTQHDRTPRPRDFARADRRAPRPARSRDPRLRRRRRAREPGQRRVRPGRDALRDRPRGSEAQRGLAVVPRVGAVDAFDRSERRTTLVAGVASPPLQLSLASAVVRPVTVTLRSSSPAGAFSTSPAGPWTSTLAFPCHARRARRLLLPRHARRHARR